MTSSTAAFAGRMTCYRSTVDRTVPLTLPSTTGVDTPQDGDAARTHEWQHADDRTGMSRCRTPDGKPGRSTLMVLDEVVSPQPAIDSQGDQAYEAPK